MKPKLLLGLTLVLSGALSGCATRSGQVTQADRLHAEKAALEYMFNKFDAPFSGGSSMRESNYIYVLKAGELTSQLVNEFHGRKPAVVARVNSVDGRCIFWNTSIQEMTRDHATIYVYYYFYTESQGSYLLELHHSQDGWMAESEKTSRPSP